MQLAWLLTQSTVAAKNIKERLTKGETVDLTYDGDTCLTGGSVPQNFEKLTSPTDFLLFRGDNREAGIEKTCGLPFFQTLETIKNSAGEKEPIKPLALAAQMLNFKFSAARLSSTATFRYQLMHQSKTFLVAYV